MNCLYMCACLCKLYEFNILTTSCIRFTVAFSTVSWLKVFRRNEKKGKRYGTVYHQGNAVSVRSLWSLHEIVQRFLAKDSG